VCTNKGGEPKMVEKTNASWKVSLRAVGEGESGKEGKRHGQLRNGHGDATACRKWREFGIRENWLALSSFLEKRVAARGSGFSFSFSGQWW
jgi:hypothetical protein